MILIERVEDGRDLALAEGVIEGVVDLAGAQLQAIGGVAVDHQIGFQPLVLLVGIDVGQIGRREQRRQQLGRPGAQFGKIVRLQRVLILRVRLASADPDILRGLQEQAGAGNLCQPAAQARDHLVAGQAALGDRLQGDEDIAAIDLAAAGEADHAVDVGVRADDLDELLHLLAHQLERDALVGLDAAIEASGILLREEAEGQLGVEPEIQRHRRGQDQQGDMAVAKRHAQRAGIALGDALEERLAPTEETALLVRMLGLAQQIGAHHRRRGQRHHQ